MSTKNAVVREGVSAGLVGALSIALWFALLDAFSGQMLATPIMLGTSLSSLVLQGAVPSAAGAILGYTLFHLVAFALIGIVFALVVNGAERVPSAFIGFAMLFVAFEVGFVGWTTVLAQGFGRLTWLQVFAANLIAAGAMGFYMWRRHPTLPARVTQELAGIGAEG
jgi:hypothetical protein